jgi:hypothetical protein
MGTFSLWSKILRIHKKENKTGYKDGVFVVTVEPTALMVYKNEPDDPQYYTENDKSVAKTSMVATNPNLEYLLESYNFSITNELNKKIRPEKNPMIEVSILDNGKVNGKVIKRFSAEKRKK